MLLWTEQFSTGSRELDYQHQTLVDNLNELETLLALPGPTRPDYEAMLRTVDFLELYAKQHFTCEEHCMEHFQCPCREQNKNEHARFLALFADFQSRHTAHGFSRPLLVELHATLKQWVTSHIFKLDTQLKASIKNPPPGSDTSFLRRT